MPLLLRTAFRPAALLALLVMTVPAPLRGGPAAGPVSGEEILVLAAASTALALEETAALYAAAGGGRVRFSFASTAALARQVEAGIPADAYLSANTAWMDRVEEGGHLAGGTRSVLFSNRLVLIAPADSDAGPVAIDGGFDPLPLLGGGRLALGETTSVPAGIYAREALASLGLFDSLEDRLAPASDVRHATRLVERGESPLGIVYRTDATGEGLRVLGTFPEHLHSPIVYWIAVLAEAPAPDAARAFLSFLRTPEAAGVFTRHGFDPAG